jgi:hypothetical protein
MSLVLFPTAGLYAQSDPSDSSSTATVDDESTISGGDSSAPAAKAGTLVDDVADPAKQQLDEPSLFLPDIWAGPGEAGTEDVNAWSTVIFEGFEGVWPTGCWVSVDANSTVGGTHRWDDTNTRDFSGFWSGHPNDGVPYTNLTDTYMRCRFSLVGADAARFSFVYWLDSEASFDYFSWEYSCSGTANWFGGESRSGFPGGWRSVSRSLPCAGFSAVYLRFNFRSDHSVVDNGVWVDNIRVERFD